MNLLAVSDLHIDAQDEDRAARFVRFLEVAHERRDEVLIVGDLFALWFGWSNLTFDYQEPILDRMKQLATNGLIMYYVEGNRDFFIRRNRGNLFRTVAEQSFQRDWNGLVLYVEHGDLINPNDTPYRIWRAISKNRLSSFLLNHLPRSFVLSLGSRLESGMKGTNRKHKLYFPEEACRRFYLNRFQNGADIVIVGHFHCEKEIRLRLNEKEVLFYSLPGWELGFRYLVIPEGKDKPYFEEFN